MSMKALIEKHLSDDGTALDLTLTGVTDAIGPHLPQSLTYLYLTRTRVTDAGVAAIKAANPNLKIYR
ncbi:MAG: hypothetical protein QM523_01155 [Candidatus Pacebacteria bacterium]|nr:hypothetical protein [Candidatus Paceibacterota bacterium]